MNIYFTKKALLTIYLLQHYDVIDINFFLKTMVLCSITYQSILPYKIVSDIIKIFF